MFSSKFNNYLKERKCSAKKLSAMTDISEPTISRYRSGKTVPSIESGNIERIAKALAEISGEGSDHDEIYEDLLVAAYEDLELVDYNVFSDKISLLINELKINKSKLADELHLNVSYLSKICNEKVKPRNPIYIAEGVAHYVAYNFTSEEENQRVLSSVLGNKDEKGRLSSADEYYRYLRKWLLIGESSKSVMVENLLYKYGDYSINTYMPYPQNVKQNQTNSETNTKNKLFLGRDGLEKAFFLWVEMACQSKVNDEIFLFDEIFSEIARKDFSTMHKYVAAVEKLIKSGKKITIINNLENDLDLVTRKMIIWLPLTMSQRVSNNFLNESKDKLYRNMLLISSNVALVGNMIDHDYDNGYYTLIDSSNEIMIARQRANNILKRAEQSNVIYTKHQDLVTDFMSFMKKLNKDDVVYAYLSAPPLASMEQELLLKILERNHVSPNMSETILEQYNIECNTRSELMKKYFWNINIDKISFDRWKKEPVYVALNKDIELMLTYTYDEYEQHMASTKSYAEQFNNIRLTIEHMNFYKNMNVIFAPDKFGLVTTPQNHVVELGSTKKPIIDSFAELMYIITPKNAKEVMRDEKKRDLLLFYKQLISKS